ncbi:hypothetical protein SJ05684_b47880 (plasmid) [Sinorhizobium sojae CCBAU 05684]|uniref:Uncharacterized protein n=1 Tax=Sinorhizobium sojae CCBAU 05684 TaxID=716928 RepID=A0A249PIK4_9HYPH|nr:hypothetical protein SJ05684_b47880 [Sinorhizobium sojae CCBAU 05684]
MARTGGGMSCRHPVLSARRRIIAIRGALDEIALNGVTGRAHCDRLRHQMAPFSCYDMRIEAKMTPRIDGPWPQNEPM